MPNELSERRDSLWWVAAAPGVWALHFLLSYATAAVWCAKFAPAGGALSGARLAIFAYTAAALAAVAGVGLRGFAQYRRAQPPEPEHDSPEGRHHFLGFTLLSLAGLSALAIAYEALAAVFIGSCS